MIACLTQVATLVRSSATIPAEEKDSDGWLDSQLLAGGVCTETNAFLDDIVAGTIGTPGATFAAFMRFVVPEDTGHVEVCYAPKCTQCAPACTAHANRAL